MTPPLLPPSSPRGSHLAFALTFLPRTRRADALLFYRFCKTIDDLADAPGMDAAQRGAALDEWLRAIDSGLDGELGETIARNKIDPALLRAIVEGCASDIEPCGFESFTELESYCWKVAGAVGLVSIRLFGCTSPRSADYAVHLGHALQLVNILRDVGEDAANGRIYIPREELRRFGLEPQDFNGTKNPPPGFTPLMHSLAARARARFAAATPPHEDFHALLPARIMRAVYEKILSDMEREGFPVLQRRFKLGTIEKVIAAVSALLKRPSP